MIHRAFRLVADTVIAALASQGCRGRSGEKIPDTLDGTIGPVIGPRTQGSVKEDVGEVEDKEDILSGVIPTSARTSSRIWT